MCVPGSKKGSGRGTWEGAGSGLRQLASANKDTSGAGQKPAEISRGSTETVLVFGFYSDKSSWGHLLNLH